MHKKTLGFSLIELLIVITIIGIITMAAIPSYNKYVLKARMLEFFNLADQYKLELLEKILHTQFSGEEFFDSSIENPSEFITKLQYFKNTVDHKYGFKLTANMAKLGIKIVNSSPLEIIFLAKEQAIQSVIVWECQYNAGYSSVVPKTCKELL